MSVPQALKAGKGLETTLNEADTHAKNRSAYKEAQQSRKIFYLHWSRSYKINDKLRYSNNFPHRKNRGVTFYLLFHLWKRCSRTFRKIKSSWRVISHFAWKWKINYWEYPSCDDIKLRCSPVKSKWNKLVIRKHNRVGKDGNYIAR